MNKLRLKGREFNLVQFHFHTPSEHAFDGLRFPMEAHLVHRTCFSITIVNFILFLASGYDLFVLFVFMVQLNLFNMFSTRATVQKMQLPRLMQLLGKQCSATSACPSLREV